MKRYVCMICRNEIPHRGAECPYCKSRSMIAEGASPRVLTIVFCVMAAVFVITGLYTRTFRLEGQARSLVHFEAAEMDLAGGRHEAAIGHYRDSLLYSRNDPRYRLGLARALHSAERFSESETYLVELRGEDPTSGIVNLLLARLAARSGRIDEAVSHYRTAIAGHWEAETNGTRLQIRFELVDLLEESDRRQLLTAELLELAETAPDDRSVGHRLARLLMDAEVYDRASALFRSLVASDGSDRAAMLGLAESEFQLGNYRAARSHFAAALLRGEDEETRSRLALCNQIHRLDPARPGIGADQRSRRSRALVRRALGMVRTCLNPLGESLVGPQRSVPPDLAPTVERAEAALGEPRRTSSETEVEASIVLAEEIWSLGAPLCRDAGHSDAPLAHVMRMLAR